MEPVMAFCINFLERAIFLKPMRAKWCNRVYVLFRGGAINTNNFFFSVSDVKLADTLDKCIGKSVKVHYIQYRKSLPWRGENYNGKNQENGQYIIDRIENVSEAHLNSGF